jgi:hypothetical protein
MDEFDRYRAEMNERLLSGVRAPRDDRRSVLSRLAQLLTSRSRSPRSERQGRAARLLDLRLHQLHSHHSRSQALEEKYPNELVVIGVHSAKFENEKETENIRRIVLRYGSSTRSSTTPTSASGTLRRARVAHAGPHRPGRLRRRRGLGRGQLRVDRQAVGELVADAFRSAGRSTKRPLKFALERAKTGDLPLAFPGKVLADEKGDRLFIADSNHNRVVVTRLDGTLLYTVGSGARGRRMATSTRATLRRPAGARARPFGDDALRRRHAQPPSAPRRPQSRAVETLAGTGAQLRDYRARRARQPAASPAQLAVGLAP